MAISIWRYSYFNACQLDKKIDETIDHLQEIVAMAPDKLIIMPGGGVTYQNAANVVEKLGVKEVHGSKIIAL